MNALSNGGHVHIDNDEIALIIEVIENHRRRMIREGRRFPVALADLHFKLSVSGTGRDSSGTESATERIVGVEEAARLMAVTPRTVRRRAAWYGGKSVNGSYVFDRDVIAAMAKEMD